MDEVYRSYYQSVEQFWALHNGKQLIVSPGEFAVIETWFQAGIPLGVVEGAIERFFVRKRKARRQRYWPLTQVVSDVQKVFEDYQLLNAGAHQTKDTPLWPQTLKKIARRVKGISLDDWPQPNTQMTIKATVEALHQLSHQDFLSLDTLTEALRTLEHQFMTELNHLCPFALAEEWRQEFAQVLDEEEDAAKQTLLWHNVLKIQLGVPTFSALGG
jgi:hypothetical protein